MTATALSIGTSVKLIPGCADIDRTPAVRPRTSGTGNRPAHHLNTPASTLRSEAGPDFSIHCRPSSRLTRKTDAPDFPMTIGDLDSSIGAILLKRSSVTSHAAL